MIAAVREAMQLLLNVLEAQGISVAVITVQADDELFIMLREATDELQGE